MRRNSCVFSHIPQCHQSQCSEIVVSLVHWAQTALRYVPMYCRLVAVEGLPLLYHGSGVWSSMSYTVNNGITAFGWSLASAQDCQSASSVSSASRFIVIETSSCRNLCMRDGTLSKQFLPGQLFSTSISKSVDVTEWMVKHATTICFIPRLLEVG